MKQFLFSQDIYLPDLERVDGKKWASVACDQFTSQPEYWQAAYELAKDSPSTLKLMLPEAFLDESEKRIPEINACMKEYLDNVLVCHSDCMIYLERTQSDGRVRRGIVGAVDLELYDYHKGSTSPIRATEGTVLERIPPRVEVRRGAVLEMPHIMILIDDSMRTVVEQTAKNIAESPEKYPLAYDFDLMAGGGHVCGRFIGGEETDRINSELEKLAQPDEMKRKYGVDCAPLLFAIGDGNHSLASAKALYEEIKAEIGEEAARTHPARFALCEIVNLHDDALEFEPIYRVVFGVEPESFLSELSEYAKTVSGHGIAPQRVEFITARSSGEIVFEHPECQLTVGSVQLFLDKYVAAHPEAKVDYIHGIDTTKALAQKENAVGLIFEGMKKDELFKTVICDGALPRKTFSMGHAEDKRYYIECRKIR